MCDFLCCIYDILKCSTFWTAVGAIGTVATAFYAAKGAQKANPLTWLDIKRLFVYLKCKKETRDEDEAELGLFIEAYNKGLSDIGIINVEFFIYSQPQKIKLWKRLIGIKHFEYEFSLIFGSYEENKDVIQRYVLKRLSLSPHTRDDDIIDENLFNCPILLTKEIKKLKDATKIKIVAYVRTTVEVYKYELSNEEVSRTISALHQNYKKDIEELEKNS